MGQIFDTLLVHPIINALLAIFHVLENIGIPYALGFSIIILTILIRVILYPFTAQQLKASKKMQDLAPHLSKLKEKHKGNAQRLQQETMALYKEHGINPAAGCLPVLIQLPVIWAIYSVFTQVVGYKPEETISKVNAIAYTDWLKLDKVWQTDFFGLPLGQNPSQLINSVGVAILLVPVITGVLQFIQTKMMLPVVKKDEKKKDEKKEPDFATAFQTQSLYIFPIMIGFFSYQFPIGLSLYWNTFSIFGIIQQYQLQGLGGLESWFKKDKAAPREEMHKEEIKKVKSKTQKRKKK
jgi:YidC/Oxa1 family membrane protein insertase